MRTILATVLAVLMCSLATAQDQVDMELMTYLEVAEAMQKGKTTVLIYNAGMEHRGPHAVLGGHTLIVRRASVEIARQLRNALVAPVAPVLPFSPAESFLKPKWPGTASLPRPVFVAVNEAIVDSMVVNGFKNIVLMGDHGGIHDTSLLMFLGGDLYVRKDKLVAGDPVPGQPVDPNKPLVDTGVTGDPRPSTPEFGKLFFDIQIRNAVAQIRSLIDSTAKGKP